MEVVNQLNAEVREVLNRYVDRRVSLGELQAAMDTFEPRIADLESDTFAAWAVDLIDIILAEAMHGHRTELDLLAMIRDEILMRPATYEVDLASSNSVSTVTEPVTFVHHAKELVVA